MADNAQANQSGATALAVISLVFGILAHLILAHAFGVTAIVCGSIAGARGRVMGWIGMSLGILAVVFWAIQMIILFG